MENRRKRRIGSRSLQHRSYDRARAVWIGRSALCFSLYCAAFAAFFSCNTEEMPVIPCITSFGFSTDSNPTLTGDIIATIDEENGDISATMPYETDVTALVATFVSNGEAIYADGTVQISGVTSNDFMDGLCYTVIMADGSFRDYWISVAVTLNPAKEITSFSFPSAQNTQFPADLESAISGTDIATTVVSGTVVTGLVAAFEKTGVRVTVNGVEQQNGTTVNDFSSAVIYTVEAEDGSTRDHTVHVNISSLAYGDAHLGGLLFYLDGLGHGLVAATSDQGMATWCGTSVYIGGTGIDIGTGAANTYAIVTALGEGTYAAKLCHDLNLNGYTDWFLPSIEELHLMYTNLHLAGLGNFGAFPRYFSSSEISQWAYAHDFSTGEYYLYGVKASNFQIRAARAF